MRNSKLQKYEPEQQRTMTLPAAGRLSAAMRCENTPSRRPQTALIARPVRLFAYQSSTFGARPRKRIIALS